MTARPLLVVGLAGLSFGCNTEQHPETVGCRSIAECGTLEVCDVPAGRCVPIPENGFKGLFACDVRVQGEPLQSAPGSEIVGKVNGFLWSLPVGANCTVFESSPGVTALDVSVLPTTGFDALSFTVDAAQISAGSVSLDQARMFGVPNTASLWTPDTDSAIAHSAAGFVTLDGPPLPGAFVQGYLDVTVHPVVDADVLFGVPCPRGLADCGQKLSTVGGASLCSQVQFQSGEVHDVCTRPCSADGDCVVGKGICNMNECSRPCATNDECQPPLVCAAGNPGESNGCF